MPEAGLGHASGHPPPGGAWVTKSAYRLLRRLRSPHDLWMVIVAVGVGLASGGGALAFEGFVHLLFHASYTSPDVHPLWAIAVPALGAAGVVWWLTANGDGAGHGVPQVIYAVALKGGAVAWVNALRKSLGAVIVLGTGNSAGPEGPVVHLGSGLGARLGEWLGLSQAHARLLIGCGASAALSAVFQAPITGVIFALEIILVDFAIESFVPIIVASVTGAVLSFSVKGDVPVLPHLTSLDVRAYRLWELPMFAVVGVVLGVLILFEFRLFDWLEDRFARFRRRPAVLAGCGGAVVGLISVWVPEVRSVGYEALREMVTAPPALTILVAWAAAKLVATIACLSTGSPGGIFAPTLFIGAAVGACLGQGLHMVAPTWLSPPAAYAVVGMGAALSGTVFAPITTVLMVFELTDNFRLILPLLIGSLTTLLVVRQWSEASFYTRPILRAGIPLTGARNDALLSTIRVDEVMERAIETVRHDTPLGGLVHLMAHTSQHSFPVLGPRNALLGLLPVQTVRTLLEEHDLNQLIIASELVEVDHPVIAPSATLLDAMHLLEEDTAEELVVVNGTGEVEGLLSRRGVLEAAQRRLLEPAAASHFPRL